MKVRFSNGIIKNCNAPTEQKIINRIDGKTFGVGWSVILRLTGEMTSDELDNIFTEDNIKTLEFFEDSGDLTADPIFILYDYDCINSSSIHYADKGSETYSDIHLSKGV